jgi:hypothetical protein
VDDELAKLKANMLPPGDAGPAKQLNPASPSAVDEELEKMRRELK